MVERAQAMIPPPRRRSSPFAVDHVAYELATRYAERQTRPEPFDPRVLFTRLATRWLPYGRGRETRPDIWAPGAGEANGTIGYLIGQAVGFQLRRSEDRKAVRETSLSRDPEYLIEEAKTDPRSSTRTKEVMGEG